MQRGLSPYTEMHRGWPRVKGCREKLLRSLLALVAAMGFSVGSVSTHAFANTPADSAMPAALQALLYDEFPPVESLSLQWMDEHHQKILPPSIIASVRAHLKYWTTHGRNELQQRFDRAGPYLPLMKSIFREEGLPEDLVYVALLESGLDPAAVSGANAVGPWQFTLPTARNYGLRTDGWIDERRDLLKSTNAAAKYLKDLHGLFGSWPLALASYNTGPTRVRQAMRQSNASDFWHLKALHQIHRETRNYVPKFIASVVIAANMEAFGFTRPIVPPIEHDDVLVGRSTDLRLLALYSGSSYEHLKELNPAIQWWATPPDGDAYRVRLPKGARKTLHATLFGLPEDWRIHGKQHQITEKDMLVALLNHQHNMPLSTFQSKVISFHAVASPLPPIAEAKRRSMSGHAVQPIAVRLRGIRDKIRSLRPLRLKVNQRANRHLGSSCIET
jgi:membrane-bound lytic murein transglycosylase D